MTTTEMRDKLLEIVFDGIERYPDGSLCVGVEETVDKLSSLFSSELSSLQGEVEKLVHRYTDREIFLMSSSDKMLAKEHNRKLDDFLALMKGRKG